MHLPPGEAAKLGGELLRGPLCHPDTGPAQNGNRRPQREEMIRGICLDFAGLLRQIQTHIFHPFMLCFPLYFIHLLFNSLHTLIMCREQILALPVSFALLSLIMPEN